MPELPEVETTKRGIAHALLGARVIQAVVRERRLRWPIAANFETAVHGQAVRSVERRAKYILIGFGPMQAAETPRIMEAQHPAAVQL